MDQAQQKELLELFTSKLNDAMRLYLDTCTRCGVCIEACHVYASMPEIKHSAVYRAEVIRRLYQKYFKLRGKIWPSLGDGTELSDELIDHMYEAAYSCTGCRRCMVYCPFGIDTQMIMSIAKLLLIGADREPKLLTMLADMSIQKGKADEATRNNFAQAIKNLEAEVIEKWRQTGGDQVVPLNIPNANLLYVALAGKHSIIPAAAIMNAAGEKWSLSYYEAVNFGAFVGNPQKTKEISRRIIDEAIRLKVKEVSVCECGTAFRVLRHQMGQLPFKVTSFVEKIARYLKQGRIKLDKSKLKGTLTYHDPCQLARNGGVIDEAKFIISHLTDNFIELSPDPKYNWCCGGGGGLVAVREKEFRMKSAKVKAEQVRATKAEILSTACENCHTQLSDLNDHYQLGMEVKFLSSLVADALVE